eukprot:TRINITY_DN2718_c0_g1_i3.p1 TRINITY_DN2718_c0_g1~~TRINITY_DN2718_c0_g1_i3.p1  ORF type:complete len:406 (-),score=69.13 TRINITY_DN2718_c0_g1_i3:125-1342(-)
MDRITSAPSGNFEQLYTAGKTLGSGAFSVVRLATRNSDGQKFAVKIIRKSSLRSRAVQYLKTEVVIMERLKGHPKVCHLEECFEDNDTVWLVLEYIPGGELFEQIEKSVFYTEQSGSLIIGTILSTILYCHERGVVHRDLKPENLLCLDRQFKDLTDLKLTDFGISAVLDKGGKLVGSVGTPMYAAPEVISDKDYDFSVDLWSLGVISYIVLGGYAPFQHKDPHTLNRLILSGKFEFHSPEWDEVSEISKDFIRKLLVVDPAKRMTGAQALNHPFLKEAVSSLSNVPKPELAARLAKFNAERKFKATIESVMVGQKLFSNLKAVVESVDFCTSNWDLIRGVSTQLSHQFTGTKLVVQFPPSDSQNQPLHVKITFEKPVSALVVKKSVRESSESIDPAFINSVAFR